ncbi:RNA polymerase recycling motor HelD [Clostridium ganghwense]|uniref:UvrD-helicase domain-containing protein n=1 Tax=Clostridium ganghwense TaxID=312089 RepID=A0ABT4CRI4_9CLOT|nr:RNA polymerase recycling motor HelD [Clostridium ganghwense]MCY6370826.1 UvrD-helicase domain-containing protein [Clostridium ganghwense]
MTLKKNDLQLEKENLKNIKIWIKKEIESIAINKEKLKEKIAHLKKKTRSYNVELEINNKLYKNTAKNYKKYSEAMEQPYFARIDFKENLREEENFYIGKFGLYDSKDEEEIVIDWRSPIADLYYSGTQGKASYDAPVGEIYGELLLKRKFLFKNSKIVDIFDEGINDIILKTGMGEEEGNSLIDEFLKINLEENVSSKLKDVVATIQKEQNDIIRADINKPIIVQGSAGSGKTTVALHRLAYLLYRYKNKIEGKDILVIAPNKLFLDYISEVLPSLGADDVTQITFEEMVSSYLGIHKKIYNKDEKLGYILECKDNNIKKLALNSSKLKGSAIFKILIDRYIRYLEIRDTDIESIMVEEYVLFDKNSIKRLYAKDLVHLPLNKRKDEMQRYINGRVNEKVRGICDEIELKYSDDIKNIKKSMSNGEEQRKKIIELYDRRDKETEGIKDKALKSVKEYFRNWKDKDILKLYNQFLTNEEIFNEVTKGKIPKNLSEYMMTEIRENLNKGIIDSDDLAALMYLKFKIDGNNNKYKHIVVDEAQDYSVFQLEILKEMSTNTSLTIVGDVGQGIYYYKGIEEWEKVIDDTFKKEATYVQMTQSYRSTVEIINFANKVLRKQKNNLKPALPVLRHGKEPEIIKFDNDEEFVLKLDKIVKQVEAVGKNNIAIIGRHLEECSKIHEIVEKHSVYKWNCIKDNDTDLNLGKIILPSYMTKGLEFDCSVIYNCNDENYKNIELDKKLLYVVLTRALHLEYIFYNGNKSILIE